MQTMRNLSTRVILLVLTFSTPSVTFAWGREGHAVIGAIAQRHLTPRAQAAVTELLVGDLDAHGQASGRTTLAEVASWADEYRATAEGRKSAGWHFEDVPICSAPNPDKVCPQGVCIATELPAEIALLKDRAADRRARNEALKWVVHLIGDLHQPLHVSDHDDRGGNDVKVAWFGRDHDGSYPLNLHAVWDTMIIRQMIADDPDALTALVNDEPSAEEVRLWTRGDLQDWATEGNILAKSVVYADLGSAFSCPLPIHDVVPLGEEYYRATAPVVRMRLRQAGIRLAAVLNAALDPPSEH